jgi:UDP-N-acetylglucosamine 2-epimerase (non-hydrolysing)
MADRIRVLTVVGTRPEAIKMMPVIRELRRHPDVLVSKLCVTAQHRGMLDQVLELFDVAPDHDLNIMRAGQSLADVTTAVLTGLQDILSIERPDWVLVHGDTTTTMGTTLAAFYLRIPVAHVEAGLRTYDKYQPFPEEVNRRIVGVVADLHFAPTEWAADNLRHERVPIDRIFVTGNTAIDALRYIASTPFSPEGTVLGDLPVGKKRIVLVTAHRRENLGVGIDDICSGLRTLAEGRDDVHLVYPVHPNPSVQAPVRRWLESTRNVTLLPALDYRSMVWLLERCHFVITDSGGLQEEAPALGKPVLVLRNRTERPEGVEAGAVRLIGTNSSELLAWANRLLDEPAMYESMRLGTSLYGDGRASRRIVEVLYSRSGASIARLGEQDSPDPSSELDLVQPLRMLPRAS